MLVFGAMNASAQLTVYHNGNVNIGSEQPTSNVSLSVGNVAYSDTTYHVSLGLHNPASGCYNIGGEGVAYSPTTRNTGRAFGLRGVAGNCTSGYNFGVLGALQGSQAGAAVFGTTSGKTLGLRVDGLFRWQCEGYWFASRQCGQQRRRICEEHADFAPNQQRIGRHRLCKPLHV